MKDFYQIQSSFCLRDWYQVLTFHGRSAERLDVVRGALRDEYQRWEARKHEGEDVTAEDEE